MVLITGSTGLLGSHILLNLVQKGKTMRALKRKNSRLEHVQKIFHYYAPGHAKELFQKIEWVEGDILDIPCLEEALEGIHEVYHAGAMFSFNRKDKLPLKKNYILGTANVVNISLAQGVKKLCYISSVDTLNDATSEGIVVENTPLDKTKDDLPYAYTKYLAEIEAWRGSQEGLGVVIVNPTFILASGFWQDSSGMLIEQVRKRGPFYTEGVTGYVDARDVAECCTRLMDGNHLNQRYILNSENLSYKEMIGYIRKELDLPPAKSISRNTLKWISRLSRVTAFLSGKNNPIPGDIIESLTTKTFYSNEKIKKTLSYEFIPVKIALSEHIKRYQKEHFQ